MRAMPWLETCRFLLYTGSTGYHLGNKIKLWLSTPWNGGTAPPILYLGTKCGEWSLSRRGHFTVGKERRCVPNMRMGERLDVSCSFVFTVRYKTQTSSPPVGFELAVPASEQPHAHALDRIATEIGTAIRTPVRPASSLLTIQATLPRLSAPRLSLIEFRWSDSLHDRRGI